MDGYITYPLGNNYQQISIVNLDYLKKSKCGEKITGNEELCDENAWLCYMHGLSSSSSDTVQAAFYCRIIAHCYITAK